jgi:APA family basic amino acid/polyamine antiporter
MSDSKTSQVNPNESQNFKGKITLTSAVLLGIGSITGSGIYVLIGPVVGIAGSGILVCFIIDFFVAILIASCYAECASVMTTTGGGFVYIKEAYGSFALFIGWIIWLSNMAYAAILSISIGIFLAELFGFQDNQFLIVIISIVPVVLFSYFNARGSDKLAKIQNPLIFALLASFIIGAVYLFIKPPMGSFLPLIPYGFLSILSGSALLFDIFIGFEDLCAISEEIENPKRNVPKALIYCLVISGVFYILVIVAIVYALSQSQIVNNEIPFLFGVQDNPVVYFIVFIGAIFALLTSIGVAVMASSRNLFALARFDFIDRKWGEINKKYNVPIRALVLSVLMVILILISGKVVYIASISNVSYIVSVIFVAATVLKFRKTKTYPKEAFKIPFFPYSVYLAIALCIVLVAFINIESLMVTISWFMIGLIIYLFFSNKNRVKGTIILVVLFFLILSYNFIGILALILGILYYLFKIANINSRVLLLAGIKFLAILSIWFLAALSTNINNIQFLAVFIPISIVFSIISVFFDIVPLREIYTFIERKYNTRNIPMQFGDKYIVLLANKKIKFIRDFNNVLNIIIMGISIVFSVILVMNWTFIIPFEPNSFTLNFVTTETFNFLWGCCLLVTIFAFFISAYMSIKINKQTQQIDNK